MSDLYMKNCKCGQEQRLPPGSGIARASVLGLIGIFLAAVVWMLSGAWLCTLLTWLAASPSLFMVLLVREALSEPVQPSACDDGRCLFRFWPSSLNGALNV